MGKKIDIELFENIVKNRLEVGSGACEVIEPKLKTVLNQYGEYCTLLPEDNNNNFYRNTLAHKVTALYPGNPTIAEISEDLYLNSETKQDSVIGIYRSLYLGNVLEGDFRVNGSSGGLGSWIIKELFKQKKIDGVIHLKLSNDGRLFSYQVSYDIEDALSGSGTKYYPGEFSKAINEIKKKDGRYAFVGIPSIIYELRLLATVDTVVARKIKYTIGLIAGHQKSTKYTEAIAWQFGISPEKLLSIDYRKKDMNSNAADYFTEVRGYVDDELRTIAKKQNEIFVSDWGQGMFKVNFSDYTDDALNETADISLGDAWLAEYADDPLGDNIVIVRSKEMMEIIKSGIKGKTLELDPVTPETIKRSQSGLIHHYIDELSYRLKKFPIPNECLKQLRHKPGADIPILKKRIQSLRSSIRDDSRERFFAAVDRNDWHYFYDYMLPSVKKYTRYYRLIYLRKLTPKDFIELLINKLSLSIKS